MRQSRAIAERMRAPRPSTCRSGALVWIPIGLVLLVAIIRAAPALAQERSGRDHAVEGERRLQLGEFDGAFSEFHRAREILEASSSPDRDLVDYLAVQLYNLGVRYNNAKDAAMALDCFIEAARLGVLVPRMRDEGFRRSLFEATLSVADFLLASGANERPSVAYELLHELSPRDARPLVGLGKSRLAASDLQGAYDALARAAEIEPQSVGVSANLGRLFLETARRLGRGRSGPDLSVQRDRLDAHESAVAWLSHAHSLDPSSGARLNELAGALAEQGRALARTGHALEGQRALAESERHYREAVSRDPQSPWFRQDLAMLLFRQKRYLEAAEQLLLVETSLSRNLEAAPADRDAASWRKALAAARENRAIAGYNLAVDAVNRAAFDAVEGHLRDTCGLSDAWARTCATFRELVAKRRTTFEKTVAGHRAALKQDPDRAFDLLALGDLYAHLGAYDQAIPYYDRLRRMGADVPDLEDRIAAVLDPGPLSQLTRTIEVPGGVVTLVYFDESARDDLTEAIEASWLRVTTALGADALGGALQIVVYPNKRSFRENAGYRVGGLVKGFYGLGRISVYATPSHTVLEWISVLTHEMTHHAVEILSNGSSPHWFSEGVARYVQGDTTVVDRDRLRRRLTEHQLPPLSRLDDLMEHSWNDPEIYLDALDASLLAVEEMARGRGIAGLRKVLVSLGAHSHQDLDLAAAVRGALGADLEGIDRSWRSGL